MAWTIIDSARLHGNCSHSKLIHEVYLNPNLKRIKCEECGEHIDIGHNINGEYNYSQLYEAQFSNRNLIDKSYNMNNRDYDKIIRDRTNTLEQRIKAIKKRVPNDVKNYEQRYNKQVFNTSKKDLLDAATGGVISGIGSIINSVNTFDFGSNSQSTGTNSIAIGYNSHASNVVQQSPNKKLNLKEHLSLMFYVHFEDKVFDDIKYYDIVFDIPEDQNNPNLDILKDGDVVKWEMVRKDNNFLSYFLPKTKKIKTIRINSEELEKKFKNMINGSN